MKTAMLAVLAAVALGSLTSGCMSKEYIKVHKGHLCITNGEVVEVKDVREEVKFTGLLVTPEKKKSCNVVIKTDQNEVVIVSNDMLFAVNEASGTAKDSYVECSDASKGRHVAIIAYEDKPVGVYQSPNPYLEERKLK